MRDSVLLRSQDSNLGPLGYEPNELPLLHSAMYLKYGNQIDFRTGSAWKRDANISQVLVSANNLFNTLIFKTEIPFTMG